MDKEQRLVQQIYDNEYTVGKSNQSADMMDFEAVLDMFELKRTEKEYDWLSDIFIPELPAMILTDASQWANQYFQSRDFVDVYLEGDKPEDKSCTAAVKKLINKSLNNKDVYYFQKYMRMRLINSMAGSVWLKCWWEGDVVDVQVGEREVDDTKDVYGEPMTDPLSQTPAKKKVPVMGKKINRDCFNFDVIEPRNVFTDNKYCYSAQDKDWIIIRSEMSYDELKANEKKNGYVNLDKLLELDNAGVETETSQETYNKDDKQDRSYKTSVTYCDVLERFGKIWAVVKKASPDGKPLKIDFGLDENGKPLPNAQLIEGIVTIAVSGANKILIRFQATPFYDGYGNPYKPCIRGQCYVHPTKDTGMSSGKYLREEQIAINDTFNMSQDRVKLATLPTFKGKKYSLEDNSTIYVEPEHVMLMDDPVNDLQELVIRSDINGALNQIGMLQSGMQKVESIYPTTMGELPGKASTTATAVAGAESRGNARANYKSLTVEFSLLTPLYDMLIMMTEQFMHPETALKIMGEDAYNFKAASDYTYKPVSSNIEMEYNKNKKIQMYDQTIGRLVNMAQVLPKVVPIIAQMIKNQLVLQGDEYQDIAKMIGDLAQSQPVQEVPQGASQGGNMPPEATSNQNGAPQSPQEQDVRAGAGGGV